MCTQCISIKPTFNYFLTLPLDSPAMSPFAPYPERSSSQTTTASGRTQVQWPRLTHKAAVHSVTPLVPTLFRLLVLQHFLSLVGGGVGIATPHRIGDSIINTLRHCISCFPLWEDASLAKAEISTVYGYEHKTFRRQFENI